MTDLVLGIDEAGRGPAVGPLVLAAVAVDAAAAERLCALGVADSKAFGSGVRAGARRAALAAEIERLAMFTALEVCDVATVDEYAATGRLNVLERERAARLIRRAPAVARVLADGQRLFGPLRAVFAQLEACDRAEAVHVAVAAASVCAKARRDELFACIAARYRDTRGPITGAGYANDGTGRWVAGYVETMRALPPEARVSWPWKTSSAIHRVGPLPPRQLDLL